MESGFSAEDLSTIGGIATVSLLHSFIPTHWLPFSIVGRAQKWTLSRTLLVSQYLPTLSFFFSFIFLSSVDLDDLWFRFLELCGKMKRKLIKFDFDMWNLNLDAVMSVSIACLVYFVLWDFFIEAQNVDTPEIITLLHFALTSMIAWNFSAIKLEEFGLFIWISCISWFHYCLHYWNLKKTTWFSEVWMQTRKILEPIWVSWLKVGDKHQALELILFR